jgi:hypothetical protein
MTTILVLVSKTGDIRDLKMGMAMRFMLSGFQIFTFRNINIRAETFFRQGSSVGD